jgi:hypothetical protein
MANLFHLSGGKDFCRAIGRGGCHSGRCWTAEHFTRGSEFQCVGHGQKMTMYTTDPKVFLTILDHYGSLVEDADVRSASQQEIADVGIAVKDA